MTDTTKSIRPFRIDIAQVGIDRLLTNVMLYWLTDTASSAAYVGYTQESS